MKKKGCDAIWWLMEEGDLVSYGAGGMCSSLCTEAGGKWTGYVSLEESWHEVGQTEVVGECAFGTLATETEVLAMGAVGSTCSL